jgi:hypothetical protein
MSLIKLSLDGNNLIIPAQREILVIDIPAGDGKIVNLFFTVYSGLLIRYFMMT